MRPVNLLPERYRPHAPTGRRAGSAYAVLAVLGAVLVAVLVYALTANQVTARKAETVQVEREAAEAEARVAELAPFADFREVTETRIQSVTALAQARLDWERLSRELAHILPAHAWLTGLEASTVPSEDAAPATTAGQPAPTGPTVALSGCAKAQPVVARLLIRLRRLDGVTDVRLGEASKGESTGEGTGAADTGDCGRYYAFEATVELAPQSAAPPEGDDAGEVPASLGGGQ